MTERQTYELTVRIGRSLALSSAARWGLLVFALMAAMGLWSVLLPSLGSEADFLALMAALVAWLALSVGGAPGLRMLNLAGAHMANRQFDQAERALVSTAGSFTVFRAARLLAVYNLAALAHGRGQFSQSAMLCELLLAKAGRLNRDPARRSRMLLADSRLMMGDLGGAYRQLEELHRRGLSPAEQLALMPTRCYYEVCAGAWPMLSASAGERSKQALLLPAPQASVSLACLALGCRQASQPSAGQWLWQQATLLWDRESILARFPRLSALPAEWDIQLPWTRTAEKQAPQTEGEES